MGSLSKDFNLSWQTKRQEGKRQTFAKCHIELGAKLKGELLPGPNQVTDTKDQVLGHIRAEKLGSSNTVSKLVIAHKQPGWRNARAGLYADALLNTLK